MNARQDDWVVYSHGKLQELTPQLWQVQGRLPKGNIPRNMAVYRMPNGELLLHSVICLGEEEMARLEALGRPSVMIVPNAWHRLDAPRYKKRFPQLRVICPEAARAKVAQVVAVDDNTDAPLPGVTVHLPAGCKPAERVYELALSNGSALIVGDLMMNLPLKLPGLDGLLFRWLGSTGFFGTTRIGRLLLLEDRRAFARFLRSIAERNIQAISLAHGAPLTERCGEHLREAANRLSPI